MEFKKGSFMALHSVGKGKNENDFPQGTVFGKNRYGDKLARVPTDAILYGTYAIHKDGSAKQGDWTVSDVWSGMAIQYFAKRKQAKYFVTEVRKLVGGAFPITSYSNYDFAAIMEFIDMPNFIRILQEARAL